LVSFGGYHVWLGLVGSKFGLVWFVASKFGLVWWQQCWFGLVKYAGSDERDRTGYYA
jgi:hypothetical protein